jgi:hypothetical protein
MNTKYTGDQSTSIVKSHESSQPNMYSTIKVASKVAEELNQSNEKSDTKKEGIPNTKAKLEESLEKKWDSIVMHVHYIRNMDRQLTGEADTILWLSRGDQALRTKYRATKILQTQTANADSVSNLMSFEHIISACPILAEEQYIKRHGRVCVCVLNYTLTCVRKKG